MVAAGRAVGVSTGAAVCSCLFIVFWAFARSRRFVIADCVWPLGAGLGASGTHGVYGAYRASEATGPTESSGTSGLCEGATLLPLAIAVGGRRVRLFSCLLRYTRVYILGESIGHAPPY